MYKWKGSEFMCETSGSCAVPKQSYILDKLPVPTATFNQPYINKVVINEMPKRPIDDSKQICYYA